MNFTSNLSVKNIKLIQTKLWKDSFYFFFFNLIVVIILKKKYFYEIVLERQYNYLTRTFKGHIFKC